ncbi:MAG: type II secretion system protein GspJ [Gammaproteobacteria bacterium]|nr:MAG: type II secretion system protein GspJ [Gammaproteobacteria bacterium]
MSYHFEKTRSNNCKESGFTLIEILVAVAIFGLIGVVSGQLLVRVVQAQQASEERADHLADLQRAMALFERDVLQAAPRPIRDGFGDPQPALRLEVGGSLEFTRHGWSNPLGLARSDLQRVAWELDAEGNLERRFWSVLDRAQDTSPRSQRILEGVERLTIQLLDADGGAWEAWPRDDRAAGLTRLPGEEAAAEEESGPELAALRLEIVVPPFGRVERLLQVPRPAPSLARPEPGIEDDTALDIPSEPDSDPQPEPSDPGGASDSA